MRYAKVKGCRVFKCGDCPYREMSYADPHQGFCSIVLYRDHPDLVWWQNREAITSTCPLWPDSHIVAAEVIKGFV